MNPLNSKIDLSSSFNKLKTIIMAKATIKRVKDPINNETKYIVYKDDNVVKVLSFKETAPEGDVYNEKANFNQAMEVAKMIESDATEIKVTVYQTPETNEDLPPGVFETPGI